MDEFPEEEEEEKELPEETVVAGASEGVTTLSNPRTVWTTGTIWVGVTPVEIGDEEVVGGVMIHVPSTGGLIK